MVTLIVFCFVAVFLTIFSYLALMTVPRLVQSADPRKNRLKLSVLALCLTGSFLAAAALYGINRKANTWFQSYVAGQAEMHSQTLRDELLAQPRYQDTLRLSRFEAKVFSQNGEDGIIAEIFRRIGTKSRYFVEFGSADGMENNTVFLLRQGWSGLWLDGDPACIARAREHFAPEANAGRLIAGVSFINAENIEKLFAGHNVPKEPDLLSIDIDRNDYHVWKAIASYRPRVVVMEYNAIFTPGMAWVVPYDANAWWDGSATFGASLSAYEALGRAKGYSLVGATLSGVNAFFVRNDLVSGKFCEPFTAANHYEPPRYWMTWGGHPRRP